MYKKFVVAILFLGVVVGGGYLLVNNNKLVVDQIQTPIQTPSKPVETSVDVNSPVFNKAITLALNEKITFPDGLNVILTQIDDSRCKEGVQCIWQGEISATLELSGGSLAQGGETRLGTVMNQSVKVEGYILSLQSATTTSVTIVVEN